MKRIYLSGQGHKVATSEVSKEAFISIRNSVSNRMNTMKAHQGDEEAKKALVQFNYNDLLPDGKLAGCCHPSSYFGGDVDCKSRVKCKKLAERFLAKKDEIGLMELSRSASFGLHYVCRRQMGRTILENQVRVAMITKTEMDTSVHDLARVMFTVTADPDELLYLNDELFTEPMTIEESEREYEVLKAREEQGLEEVPAGAKQKNSHYRPWEDALNQGPLGLETSVPKWESASKEGTNEASLSGTDDKIAKCDSTSKGVAKCDGTSEGVTKRDALSFKGIPYSDIIDEWWKQHGGIPEPGERNISLHKLAVHLRTICDNDAKQLFDIMPHLGLSDAEVRSIITSATKEQPKGLTTEMKAVLSKLEKPATSTHVTTFTQSAEPPVMPKKLPKLVKLLVSKTPDIYKPAVAQAVFPALATHLCDVRFTYIDGVEHEATLMNLLIAETGAGKSCINQPINHIMADIKDRDKVNMQREQAWNDECNSAGANKTKPKRPEDLIIQIIDADVTNAALVRRLSESQGHFLYVHMNEVQQFDALKGNGKGNQQFTIMCLAFDADNEYGQTRAGTQSVCARVKVRLNWNASTTPQYALLYFRKVLVNGPLQRINLCTIPAQPIGSPIPKYGKYDDAFDAALKPYIDNLCAATGLIKCREAYKLAEQLNEECKLKAIESQSRTYENFTFRATVIAYLKACVLYVANGCKWEKSIEDFVRWSLEYDLWCKMQFFGDAVTAANHFNGPASTQPQSLLASLPPVFSRQQVVELYTRRSMDPKGVSQAIRTWKHRTLILEQPDGTFKQLKYTS